MPNIYITLVLIWCVRVTLLQTHTLHKAKPIIAVQTQPWQSNGTSTGVKQCTNQTFKSNAGTAGYFLLEQD